MVIYNIIADYIDKYLDTANLYQSLKGVFGSGFAGLVSKQNNGTWRVIGEAIASPAYFIIIFQLLVSWS
ncbi:MAG: hypothetical protein HC905_30615, partial [Bacteroidales bacterium]|nr:hypothetical protein [Bacteroidales bacterium]